MMNSIMFSRHLQYYPNICDVQNHQSILNSCVRKCTKMSHFFSYFIDSSIISKIVLYTNKRIIKKEDFISETELKSLIGFLLLFGVTGKNDVKVNLKWSCESFRYSDWESATMYRDRFNDINSRVEWLSASNNSKFVKMSEILSILNSI